MRFTMKNFLLGTALTVGLLGTGAVAAHAAPRDFRGVERGYDRGYARGYFERPALRGYGVRVGGPVYGAYVPPCPGDGYAWLNGAWVFRGRPGFAAGYGRGFDRGYERGWRGRR